MTNYLDEVDVSVLTDTYRKGLDKPITLDETLKAFKSMQPGKTPGPDGIPAELYKQYPDVLANRLHNMLTVAEDLQSLPHSMGEAVIIVIPKPGKDSSLCPSYRPISLLNVDAKILAKILANRLNMVITALVHPDQTGFMPGRGTDISLRRLFTNKARADAEGEELVASLDAEKAFNSIEWRYLWVVLTKFGYGWKYISWVKMLYAALQATVYTNACLLEPFPLSRGTRQSPVSRPVCPGHRASGRPH